MYMFFLFYLKVLFNNALNTFYLRLYGVGHMVKDHSDSEKGNPLPPHGLLFPISSKASLYAPSQDSTYFVTPVMEHWLEREIAQWVHAMEDRSLYVLYAISHIPIKHFMEAYTHHARWKNYKINPNRNHPCKQMQRKKIEVTIHLI